MFKATHYVVEHHMYDWELLQQERHKQNKTFRADFL